MGNWGKFNLILIFVVFVLPNTGAAVVRCEQGLVDNHSSVQSSYFQLIREVARGKSVLANQTSPELQAPQHLCGPVCAVNALQAVKKSRGEKLIKKPVQFLNSLFETHPLMGLALSARGLETIISYMSGKLGVPVEVSGKTIRLPEDRPTEILKPVNRITRKDFDVSEGTQIVLFSVFSSAGQMGHFVSWHGAHPTKKGHYIFSDPGAPGLKLEAKVRGVTINGNQKTLLIEPIGPALKVYTEKYQEGFELILTAVINLQ